MNSLLELVLEIVMEGAIGAAGSRQVPLPVRLVLGGLLLALLLGLSGLLVWVGLDTGRWFLAALGIAMFLGGLFRAWTAVKGRK
jgi:uncharacterized membrane protein YqjE